MQLTISGHHLHVTSAIERYLMKRLRKIERHHHTIVDGQVTLSVDQDRQHAEGEFFARVSICSRSLPIAICMRRLMQWRTSLIVRCWTIRRRRGPEGTNRYL